jgi:hypothetical protein
MTNRTTGNPRPDTSGDARKGDTIPARGETQGRVPRAPHERDESADSQAAQEPSGQRVGRQGAADIARGLVDTDKRPALDEAYDKVRGGSEK